MTDASAIPSQAGLRAILDAFCDTYSGSLWMPEALVSQATFGVTHPLDT